MELLGQNDRPNPRTPAQEFLRFEKVLGVQET
jgi:hypothetical protein